MDQVTIEKQTRAHIYGALEHLKADRDLLALVGSWGDTLDDRRSHLPKEWSAEEARNGTRKSRVTDAHWSFYTVQR